MLEKNIAIRGIFTAILFITMGISQVSLEIKNVTFDVKTCSDPNPSFSTQTTCEAGTPIWTDSGETWNGTTCTDITFTTQTTCEDAGTCSDPSFITQTTCETGTPFWTEHSLNIYMTNAAGCSYCADLTYNKNTLNWVDQKEECETNDATWIAYAQITETACSAISSSTGAGGWWFDGSISGYQFFIKGITITEISGGSTVEYLNNLLLNPNADCDGDGVADEGCNLIVAFDFDATTTEGGYIPAGDHELLLSISFTDFVSSVCFDATDKVGEAIVSWSGPSFADASTISQSVAIDWGDCYCDSAYPADCTGVCGGPGVVNTDGNGACCASGVIDCADECGGTATDYNGDEVAGCGEMAISQIGSSLPEKFAISQNFPNPFNPITSITFDVAKMDEVSLVVYDLTGKEVVTLVSGTYIPGTYNVEWNAVNNAGDGIVSGMYIYRYISSEKAITRKMLYLK